MDQFSQGRPLAGIGARIKEQNAALGAMAEAPALQLTPEAMGQQIMRASEQVRAEDARLLGHAQNGMRTAAHQIETAVVTAKTAQEQQRARIWASVIGAVLGVVSAALTMSLPSIIADGESTTQEQVLID